MAGLAVIAAAVIVGLLGLSGLAGGRAGSSAEPPDAVVSPSPTSSAAAGGSLEPTTATPSPITTPAPSASPAPSPTPVGSQAPIAPTSADGFDLRGTVIDLAFPMRKSARYSYTDDFLIPRVGKTRRYNHARGVSASGRLLRAHDGIDIRAKLGTNLYAVFSGTIIDPATRWQPWDPERYGKVVVIISDEPTSLGYAALYAHLRSRAVKVGDRVERGQLIGRLGQTGNAIGTPPHLHFELRAPFRIPVREGGRDRRIDAFDPFPSLVAADPKRRD